MKAKGQKGFYRSTGKRVLDVILACAASVLLSPLILVTAILVRVKLGSPVVFKQARPGIHEKIFYLYKFRSMTNETGEDGRLLPDAQRLTKFGRILRSSSLDEILELVNIIKGDMSIVGPRPLSIYYLPHYSEKDRKRHDVRPGLTGLAQVSGRNNLQWDERFSKDIEYVENLSFGLDLKIVANTFLKVLKKSDISVRGTTKIMDFGPYCILREEGRAKPKMEGMTYSEIGSFFWLEKQDTTSPAGDVEWLPAAEDVCFTFSGRNALAVVADDLMQKGAFSKLYAPSYCCVSMLQPFIDKGVAIEFYGVHCSEGHFSYQLPSLGRGDVCLIMNYFGIEGEKTQQAIRWLHERGAVVIEDITHSLFCENAVSPHSDYYVASLRKWLPIPSGGWAAKKQGRFTARPNMPSNQAVEEKIRGMQLKQQYIEGQMTEKSAFLSLLSKFENDLIHADKLLTMDDVSRQYLETKDMGKMSQVRKRNAAVLIDGLRKLESTDFCLPSFNAEEDTPLFIPVFLKHEWRDSLKNYLIDKGIYCPVHWPEIMGAASGIRENELSLICDQRYSENDMQVIVDTITEWYRLNGLQTEKAE